MMFLARLADVTARLTVGLFAWSLRLLFAMARSVRHFPWQLGTPPLLALTLAVLTGRVAGWERVTHALLLLAVLGLAPLTVWWLVVWVAPATTVRSWVGRRDAHSRNAGGVASWLDVVQHTGRRSVRARATILRPSLAKASWWQRRRTPTTAYAVKLLSTGPFKGGVWSSCEDVTLRIGGPRSGKSGSLACHILDAPGALLVTTSRPDLVEETGEARATRGRVEVFNPIGLGVINGTNGTNGTASAGSGGLASTVRWSPLAGCTDLGTAQRRAADLVPASTGEGERWDTMARGLLTVLLHAAALRGGTLRTVLDWISPADVLARDEVVDALKASPSTRALTAEARSTYGTNDRTLTSITATLLPALRWLVNDAAAQVGDAPLDHPDFLDVAQFVARGRDSLYLIGQDQACTRLIGALTAEVAHQVRMHASAQPGGRLDPPMTAALDEAALTCGPIPLHEWTADMGGRGFTLHIAGQSLAQLRDVWGRDRADTILGNTNALLVFGGLKSATDLQDLSTIANTRMLRLDADDVRPVPVMTPGDIAALPEGTAMLVKTGTRVLIGKAPLAWQPTRRLATKRTLRAAAKAGRQAALAAQKATQPAEVGAGAEVIDLTTLDRHLDHVADQTGFPRRPGTPGRSPRPGGPGTGRPGRRKPSGPGRFRRPTRKPDASDPAGGSSGETGAGDATPGSDAG